MSARLSHNSAHDPNHSAAHLHQGSREMAVAALALATLAVVCALAFFAPGEKVALADQIALCFLAACLVSLSWPPLLHLLEAHEGATTFLLTAAMFVIYGLARRVTPENGWSMRFAGMPEDEYVFPFSAYVVVLGALFSSPFWWRKGNVWTHALLAALAVLVGIAAWSFWLLARVYSVGAAQRLDPSELPNFVFMLIEYGCLALLCRAVCAHITTRRLALRVLPLVLLALWARFHFFKPTEDAE